ncbi:MAG: hypothetical protein ACPGFA_11110 [Pikeienuella sp.]
MTPRIPSHMKGRGPGERPRPDFKPERAGMRVKRIEVPYQTTASTVVRSAPITLTAAPWEEATAQEWQK